LRGGLLIIFKEYRQAIPDFTAAIRLDPNYSDAYYWRGHAKYFVSGQERAAILDFDAAIRLNPTYTEAYYMRGRAKRFLGEYRAAITDLTEAIRLNPEHVEAYVERGKAKSFLGEYRAAITDLTEAIRLNPKHVEAYVERGTAINGTTGPNGNLRQALADFNTAIRLDSNHAFAYHGRAVVKSNLSGDYWGALDDATVAARLYKEQGDSANYRVIANYINTLRSRITNEQRGRDICIVYNSDGTAAYTTTRDRAPSGGGVECRPR
jgi:serine/threonine-protein kinase